jgi:4-amino-4-deoxy-L-arabinose transferase-like glycosyltransferase
MRRAPSIALAIVVVSILLSPLQRELYIGDETKYSQVVREMRAGSFFLPTLNGSPFTHKPPLHFWAVDLLTYVFGLFSIWPYVLPSLVSFALLLWLMQRFGGTLAAFVCGTSLLMWGSAQTARMDVAFAALLALAAYRIYRADGALTVSAGIATGFAFLVKGPMAPVIILALFAFESFRRRRKPLGKDALALLPMLLIPLLWLVPAILIGGEPYWREIFYKQTVGRAVGAWVHKSPPWFYLVRAPFTLMPWFFLAVAALVAAYKRGAVAADERAKFAVSWILAVLVPYTLLSSKLDVYMIAMLPAVALLIGRYLESGEHAWGRRANLVMLALFSIIGVAGLLAQPRHLKGEDGALIARLDVRALFAVLLIAAIVAIVITLRGRLIASTIATGFVPVAALVYVAVMLVPLANELASTRPLVRALSEMKRPHHGAQEIALYVTPHLWVRGMSPGWTYARHVDAEELRRWRSPEIIVARRKDDAAIRDVLQRKYRRVGEVRMVGKWFDIYRHDL